MTGFIIMTGVAIVLAALSLLTVQFGVDSRQLSADGRPFSLFGAR